MQENNINALKMARVMATLVIATPHSYIWAIVDPVGGKFALRRAWCRMAEPQRRMVYVMAMNNGVMTMRPLDKGLTIEPGKTVKLAPGGYHLMLMDLKSPLKKGDKVPVTLEFERAGKVKLSLDVQGVGAQAPAGAGSSGGQMKMKKMPGMKM